MGRWRVIWGHWMTTTTCPIGSPEINQKMRRAGCLVYGWRANPGPKFDLRISCLRNSCPVPSFAMKRINWVQMFGSDQLGPKQLESFPNNSEQIIPTVVVMIQLTVQSGRFHNVVCVNGCLMYSIIFSGANRPQRKIIFPIFGDSSSMRKNINPRMDPIFICDQHIGDIFELQNPVDSIGRTDIFFKHPIRNCPALERLTINRSIVR